MLAIRFPTSWNLSLGGGGSFTVATRFACGQGKGPIDLVGSEKATLANSVGSTFGGRNRRPRRGHVECQATTPDVVILARNPDRAMACDFTKHIGAKLNNRDPNWEWSYLS
jgi:hypothetical protein